MEKYIKLSDALKVCRKWNKFCFELNDAKGQTCAETIEDEILELSGADVAELKRGKWDDGIYCSVCGTAYDTGEYRNARNFCPNCGADMRGGRK